MNLYQIESYDVCFVIAADSRENAVNQFMDACRSVNIESPEIKLVLQLDQEVELQLTFLGSHDTIKLRKVKDILADYSGKNPYGIIATNLEIPL